MQWWVLILMAYNYEIEYRPSADHANWDALSRLPSKVGDGTAEGKIFYFSVMEDLPVKANDIAHSTNKDPVFSRVRELTLNCWPSHLREKTLKPFFIRRTELSVEQGCILWGMRVIVPPALRLELLHDLHQGHPGMSHMKALARSYMWWPCLDKVIEKNCTRV